MEGIVSAWGRILAGYTPALSIEITRECPLHCPGCYAYSDTHLGGGSTLRQLSDYRGQELVDRVLALVREHQPLQVSLVSGCKFHALLWQSLSMVCPSTTMCVALRRLTNASCATSLSAA